MGDVRLKDIANRAGVSVSTVSRTLSGNSNRIGKATQEKILKIASELGFAQSRTMRIKASFEELKLATIFISDRESFLSPFFTKILEGIDQEIHRKDLDVNIAHTILTVKDEAFSSSIQDSKIDAAIILGRASNDVIEHIKSNIPVIAYAGLNSIGNMDDVLCDARKGIEEAVSYLASLSRKRIAYIGPTDKQNIANEHRFRGYREGLIKANLEYDDSLVQDIYLSPQDGYDGAKTLLDRVMPDAIIAANDNAALGIIRCLNERKIKIPQEVAVTGFDNIEASAFLRPALTTFDVPKSDIGRFAAKIVIDRCLNPRTENITINIPYKLVERESTVEKEDY